MKNDQQFSGNELEESENELEETDDTPVQSTPDEKESSENEKRVQGGRRIPLFGVGLTILVVFGGLLLYGIGFYIRSNQKAMNGKEETPRVERFKIQKEEFLRFDSFVIPLKDSDEFTFVSLSISFKSLNRGLKREMIQKRDQLRGVLYNILSAEINRGKAIPKLEDLKAFIIRGANGVLSASKVHEAYVTDFLAF